MSDEIKTTQELTKRSFSIFGLFKWLFLTFLFVQFVPDAISAVKEAFDTRPRIGCVDLTGPIAESQKGIAVLEKYASDDSIKAILIRVSSPGGLPGSAQSFYYEILRIRDKKPVVVYVENCCASAAYHMSSAADYIVATPSALIGNIGSYMEIANIKGLLDDWKVHLNYIQTGKFKTMGSPMKDLSAEEQALLQSVVDDSYQQFITEVAATRELEVAKHLEWADGKIFTGQQALVLGLIDEVGSQKTALDYLKKQLKSETDLKLVTQKAPFSFINFFGSSSPEGVDMSGSSSNSLETSLGTVVGKAASQFLKAGLLGV